jgi:hypothetical protein
MNMKGFYHSDLHIVNVNMMTLYSWIYFIHQQFTFVEKFLSVRRQAPKELATDHLLNLMETL